MKFPRLVRAAHTPCHVCILGEPDAFGEQEIAFEGDLFCNYQSESRLVYSADGHTIQTAATLLFDGDIAPTVPIINSGKAVVSGVEHTIVTGKKHRNIDGSVNYTSLEVV